MRILVISLLALPWAMPAADATGKEEERLANCANVLEEILKIPDTVPHELLHKTECVAVIPSVKKIAIGFGGSYGRGALVCRSGAKFTGRWGAPAMIRLEGGNVGLQFGGQATDFLLLVMNPKGADSLLRTKVKLGADAAVAAGPKGRAALAATDAFMRAEILSYSRSRGLFAGVSLEGSTLRPDNKANEKVYRRKLSAQEIVSGSKAAMPAAGRRLAASLERMSPRNQSE